MKYMLYSISLMLCITSIPAMHNQQNHYDGDFIWFLKTHLGVPFDEAHGDNQNLEFYASVTASLQRKTMYELILLLQTSDTFVHSTSATQLPTVKHTVHAFMRKALEQSIITTEDICLLGKLVDSESLQYALQLLQPLREKFITQQLSENISEQTFLYSKLIVTLHMRLESLKKQQQTPIRASIKTCKGRPSDDWIVVNQPADTLYKEVVNEMTATSMLSASDYKVTLATTLDNTSIIMHDYQDTHLTVQELKALTQQLYLYQETLTTHQQQKKALEDTCQQLRTTIDRTIQRVFEQNNLTSEEVALLEGEKKRLLQEELELVQEQEVLKKRLNVINTRIIQLSKCTKNYKR